MKLKLNVGVLFQTAIYVRAANDPILHVPEQLTSQLKAIQLLNTTGFIPDVGSIHAPNIILKKLKKL